MAEFTRTDLSGSTFDRVDLSRARIVASDLSGAMIKGSNLEGLTLRGDVFHLRIEGEVYDLLINGIDVVPLVVAEMDRRDPERVLMRPEDPDGFRAAWALLEARWAGTVARAREFPLDQLHAGVDGEWSFIETLRHLPYATDVWLSRAILGDPDPWHPWELPFDELDDGPGVPRNRTVRPSLDEILELRTDRQARVRDYLARLTPEQLAGRTEPVDAPGFPPPDAYAVKDALSFILNEEWEHRRFAERDLEALGAGLGDDDA